MEITGRFITYRDHRMSCNVQRSQDEVQRIEITG